MASSNTNNNHHRLSRLTAKLLRRPSTSSSAKNISFSPSSTPGVDSLPVDDQPVRAHPADGAARTDSTASRVRTSWCSLETVDGSTAANGPDEKPQRQTANDSHATPQELPDPSPCGQTTTQACPAARLSTQPKDALSSTPLTAEAAPKRGLCLRRLEESNLAGACKEVFPSGRSLSVRRSDSRSTAPRTLNAVDESGQDTNLPSPLSVPTAKPTPAPPNPPSRPPLAVRRQSLVPASQQRLIKTLLEPGVVGAGGDYFSRGTPSIQPDMISRKVWVKRAGSSPTLVSVTEEDLVDDLREAILRKYANSLGRTFDAPDIMLKLVPREPSSRQSNPDRLLGPEEPVGRTLDHYYPGGQTVGEALIIEIPQRRTPRPSPRHNVSYVHPDDLRPGEADEYFPPMHSIQTPNVSSSISTGSVPNSHQHSISVITTGQLPPVPSPGSRGSWHNLQHRPKFPRQHTSSPTIIGATPAVNNMTDTVEQSVNGGVAPVPSPPTTSTPPAPAPEPQTKSVHTPPARVNSPRPVTKLRKMKKMSSGATVDSSPASSSLLDGTVPPINVLIVEDNTINLKLLEAFMKRLKVRWQTAMNGREAVNKWRGGGFHLVLMDIQLPVMNGLEATREIRRLERVNNIGVFSKGVAATSPHAMVDTKGNDVFPPKPEDVLDKKSSVKSPVIIVALTASSLQSDRDEALAAGCNDFLTKPVNMIWLEKKVTEWGCMQALIDFEGWRKWRGFDSSTSSGVSQQSTSTATITDAPLTDSPSPHLTTSKSSQGNHTSTVNSTHDEKPSQGQREPSPEPASSKLTGTCVYLKGSGKDSCTSSTSTIVPNGGSSSAGASTTPTLAGRTPTAGTTSGMTSSLSSVISSSGKRGSRASTPAKNHAL
ncbi:Two-component response regulator SSK1p, putative [Coccidioides posadasii C735 delta SOWgp]|uniref:Two-component response regulator SSK1p, putative n=1 Tax=Coccidioides posadasii (strain C735) TaxID=222929 RepID=C5P594_COCP7|nr:Two-component response regulator SSK1p, putative [Coccidioides posadasii C735 delta SOWgp]EER27884.1 Two-component response regulator SSK1p, putative [Coccidioides posadasii C735 delta SOWgp]|eukprot:XP_003070029.1 Two-component response regulator SSK1p, putative [Coccidioides posadasii C735 delta SOWgp]